MKTIMKMQCGKSENYYLINSTVTDLMTYLKNEFEKTGESIKTINQALVSVKADKLENDKVGNYNCPILTVNYLTSETALIFKLLYRNYLESGSFSYIKSLSKTVDGMVVGLTQQVTSIDTKPKLTTLNITGVLKDVLDSRKMATAYEGEVIYEAAIFTQYPTKTLYLTTNSINDLDGVFIQKGYFKDKDVVSVKLSLVNGKWKWVIAMVDFSLVSPIGTLPL